MPMRQWWWCGYDVGYNVNMVNQAEAGKKKLPPTSSRRTRNKHISGKNVHKSILYVRTSFNRTHTHQMHMDARVVNHIHSYIRIRSSQTGRASHRAPTAAGRPTKYTSLRLLWFGACRRSPVPITNWTECVFYTLPFCWFIFDIFAQWKYIALLIIKMCAFGNYGRTLTPHRKSVYYNLFFAFYSAIGAKQKVIHWNGVPTNLFPSILLRGPALSVPPLCAQCHIEWRCDAWWRHSFHSILKTLQRSKV